MPMRHFDDFLKEWFDNKTGLVRYDYKPQPNAYQPYGNDFLSEVHDFSEGRKHLIEVHA